MKKSLLKIEYLLKQIDAYRDKMLFHFLTKYWPSFITPNHLSAFRLIVGLLLIVMVLFYQIEKNFLLLLFAIAAITDFIDGPLARLTNQITKLGKILDPVADKVLVLPVAFFLLSPSHFWLLAILLLMEFFYLLASFYYRSEEIFMEANIFGKIKMTLMCIIFFFIFLAYPSSPSPFLLYSLLLTIPLTFLSIVTVKTSNPLKK